MNTYKMLSESQQYLLAYIILSLCVFGIFMYFALLVYRWIMYLIH